MALQRVFLDIFQWYFLKYQNYPFLIPCDCMTFKLLDKNEMASFSLTFRIYQVEQVAKLASPMGRFKGLLYEVLRWSSGQKMTNTEL